MRKLLLAAVCLLTTLGWSQGTAASGIPVVATGTGQPIAGATVAICSADPGSAPSVLCTGSLVTTFTSNSLSVACTPSPVTKAALSGVGCTNPGLSDGLGNVIAYANPAACWLEYTGNGIIGIVVMPCTFPALSTTGGVAIKVNGGSTLTSPVNFQNGSAVNGITVSFANPSASNVTAAISGALTNAGIANPSTTVNGQTCTLGSTCTINGIISGLTTGIIPQAGSATSIVNSTPQLDNGVTTPNTLTYLGSGGLALTPAGATGTITLCGATSGCVTFQPQAIAGTYNYNFPITAGTVGDCQKSGGGGASPMTWGACVSSLAYSAITAGSNLVAKTEGSGGSLAPTGSGQIAGTQNWFLGGILDPVLTTSSSGGSLPSGTNISVQIAFNTALGLSVPSRVISVATPGGCGISCSATITAPTLPSWATSYTAYSCSGISCSPLQQTAANSCVAITGNCVIQTVGAGAAPLTVQTAFVQPPGAQATLCPPSVVPSMFIGDTSGNYQTQAGVDPFVDNTFGPPSPGGTLTFCRRVWFNDTGASPPAGKNALVNIRHHYQNGTVLGNQDRALSILADNGTTDVSTHYGLEGIQAELDFQGAPLINGSPDGEVSTASFQLSDTHTNNVLPPAFGINGMRITTFRNGAGTYGTCTYCLFGANIQVANLSATSFAGAFFVGVDVTMNDTGPSPNASSIGIHINAPPNRFINFNRSLQLDTTGTNVKDFNIYSAGSGTGGRNFFGGNVYLPNIITAASDIAVTGSLVASGSVSTAQFATPAFNGGNVVVNGTTGSTTWTYKIAAVDGNGRESAVSGIGTTLVGNATLTGANFNQINLSGGAFVMGVGRYNIYRTVAGGTPSTTGKIGTITTSSTISPAQGLAPADIFNDTGLAGDGSTPPTVNTSGGVLAAGYVTAGLNTIRVASDFTTAANTSLQTITGLTWNLPTATAKYGFHCALAYSQATANVAVAFGIQSATQAATNIFATGQIQTNTTAFSASTLATLASTTATTIVSATPGAIATNFTAYLDGTIEEPAGTGNAINIMVSTANSGDLVTVLRGSYCSVLP